MAGESAVVSSGEPGRGGSRAEPEVRVGTWNLEWASGGGQRGKTIAAILDDADADLWVFTEARRERGPLPSAPGLLVDAGDDWGYRLDWADQRKVLVWSIRPWTEVATLDAGAAAGRLVAATTATPLGSLRVMGVCIPWWAHTRVRADGTPDVGRTTMSSSTGCRRSSPRSPGHWSWPATLTRRSRASHPTPTAGARVTPSWLRSATCKSPRWALRPRCSTTSHTAPGWSPPSHARGPEPVTGFGSATTGARP